MGWEFKEDNLTVCLKLALRAHSDPPVSTHMPLCPAMCLFFFFKFKISESSKLSQQRSNSRKTKKLIPCGLGSWGQYLIFKKLCGPTGGHGGSTWM